VLKADPLDPSSEPALSSEPEYGVPDTAKLKTFPEGYALISFAISRSFSCNRLPDFIAPGWNCTDRPTLLHSFVRRSPFSEVSVSLFVRTVESSEDVVREPVVVPDSRPDC
jgi:hypothetical protein